jgi:GPH family glycoside/pentoside/hexuronide:cation symporter
MFGAYSVLDKVANGGGAFVAGTIVSLVAFPAQAVPGTVAPDVLQNMALSQLVIVVLFNLASIAFFSRYMLTREDHERNAAILAARKAQEPSAPVVATAAPDPILPAARDMT